MHIKPTYTFIALGVLAMTVMAGCSGSTTSTTVVQGASPVIQSLSVQGLPSAPGGAITATVAAASAQGLALTYTWTTYDGWSIISGGGTSTAVIKAPSTYATKGTATVQVSDTYGRYAINTIPVDTAGNSAPAIDGYRITPNPVIPGGTMTAAVSANDPDGYALSYTWTASTGWTITGNGVTATVTAPAAYAASGTAAVTVDDGHGGTASLSIPLGTIGNSAPVIDGFSAVPNPVPRGGTMAIDVTATDPDGDTLSYTWQASDGWTIATGQGTSGITVTAPDEYGAPGTVTVTVDDGHGGTVSWNIGVSTYVNAYPVITVFSVFPQTVITSTTLTCTAYNPDGEDGLSYLWVIGGAFTLPAADGVWLSPGIPGNYTASVTVLNSGNNTTAFSSTTISISSTSVWPRFHRDLHSTGQSPIDTGSTTGALEWSYTTGGAVYLSSPAIGADGTVYIGSTDGSLYALYPTPSGTVGALKWSFTTGGAVDASPAIGADGTVYIGSNNDNVYAISPSGALTWSYPTLGAVDASPAIGADGTVYIGSTDGSLYALYPTPSGTFGALKWSCPTGGPVNASPAIGMDGTVYVQSSGAIYALDPINGGLKWSTTAAGGSLLGASPAIGPDGTIYIGSSKDNYVYALNPTDASVKWSTRPGANALYDSPAVGADGTVYIGYQDGKVYALSPTDGSVTWSHQTSNYIEGSSAAIGADGTVYIGSLDNSLYALNPTDGTVKWSYPTGGKVYSSPAIGADGTIYVGSEDRRVYAIH